ncbi:MAG: hypothetical protein LBN10_00875 [Propionibacteriaceae bacterium]|jgi:hypothetical protein|nr:hypothetical protein [Propionibacteriaceae bacterium]
MKSERDFELDPGATGETQPPVSAPDPLGETSTVRLGGTALDLNSARLESAASEIGGIATAMGQASGSPDISSSGDSLSAAVDALTDSAKSLARSTHEEQGDVALAEAVAMAESTSDVKAAHSGLATPHTREGGGMSLQDTIAQIASLQRAIQDQTRLINDFQRSNQETMQMVRTELKGSTKGYDQQMVNALSQAESSLRSSLSALQQASAALDRVKAI